MKHNYLAPTLGIVPMRPVNMVCASPVVTLRNRAGSTGEEADSKTFGGVILWNDTADDTEN